MKLLLSDEQENFLKEIEEFCRKECANINIFDLEESGSDPEEIDRKIVEKGWYGLPFPKEYGGLNRGIFELGLLSEGLMHWGYPFPGRFQLTMLNALNLFKNGSEDQKKLFLPKIIKGEMTMSISVTEPNAGSDIASLTTKAVQKDGGFLINGQKVYSSGAARKNNIIIVGARTDETRPKHRGITLFLVPSETKGIEFNLLKSLGRRIGGLYEVFFDDVWVPKENILGKLNEGWEAMTNGFNVERAIVSASYLGFAERIFDEVINTVLTRMSNHQQFRGLESIAYQVAEYGIEVQAAKLLVYHSLSLVEEGKSAIEEVCQSKLFCSELIKKLGDFAMEVSAGEGYLLTSLMQWYFRESKIVTIGGGSSQIMRNIIANLNGLKAK